MYHETIQQSDDTCMCRREVNNHNDKHKAKIGSEKQMTKEETTEKQNTGWYIGHGMFNDRFFCCCGFVKIMDSSMHEWKYCPVCGRTKIVEPKEREGKE